VIEETKQEYIANDGEDVENYGLNPRGSERTKAKGHKNGKTYRLRLDIRMLAYYS